MFSIKAITKIWGLKCRIEITRLKKSDSWCMTYHNSTNKTMRCNALLWHNVVLPIKHQFYWRLCQSNCLSDGLKWGLLFLSIAVVPKLCTMAPQSTAVHSQGRHKMSPAVLLPGSPGRNRTKSHVMALPQQGAVEEGRHNHGKFRNRCTWGWWDSPQGHSNIGSLHLTMTIQVLQRNPLQAICLRTSLSNILFPHISFYLAEYWLIVPIKLN